MMSDINFNGITMEFSIIAGKMDADLRDQVIDALGSASEQQMVDAYLQAHQRKFGHEFLQE